MKQWVVVINDGAGKPMLVHKAGCKDLGKVNGSTYSIEGATLEQAIEDDVAGYVEQGQGYTSNDYRVMPCIHAVEQKSVADLNELPESVVIEEQNALSIAKALGSLETLNGTPEGGWVKGTRVRLAGSRGLGTITSVRAGGAPVVKWDLFPERRAKATPSYLVREWKGGAS